MSSTEESALSESAFDIWWDYVCEFRDAVEHSVHSAEDDVLQEKLPQDDWFLYLVSNVIGLMSNCGSIVTGMAAFARYQADLEMALNRFGLPALAANLQASIDLYRDHEQCGEWTEEIDERHNRIDEKCDWTYTPLIEYLCSHEKDFSHSILPYCERRGWRGHGNQGEQGGGGNSASLRASP